MKYFIKTFGCQMNVADSGRVAAELTARGYQEVSSIEAADLVVVNTCMVRKSAEDRVYGLMRNLGRQRKGLGRPKRIVLTGCLVGMVVRDKKGEMLRQFKEMMPEVDEWLPIEEVGFGVSPSRLNKRQALVPISNGCNNFCSYCVVPYTRGREKSRPVDEILEEVRQSVKAGCSYITLLGQNVNSYGSDLVELRKLKPGRNLKLKIGETKWCQWW